MIGNRGLRTYMKLQPYIHKEDRDSGQSTIYIVVAVLAAIALLLWILKNN